MSNDENKTKPATNEEWTVHALNIHGAFFEKKCAYVIQQTPGYTLVNTNYPVEFPPPVNGVRGKESALDIRAECRIDDHRKMTLIIECKKNNQNFVDWIFFPSHFSQRRERLVAPVISFHRQENRWIAKSVLEDISLDGFVFSDEARETRGNYKSYTGGDKTRTANNAISEAAYQVSLAAQSVFLEEINNSQKITEHSNPNHFLTNTHIILPVIVTSANLFVCEFDVKDINISTGEIDLDKVDLKPTAYLIYKYPLPRHLHYIPEHLEIEQNQFKVEKYVKMRIIIVSSEHFQEFLQKIDSILRDSIF